MRSRIAFILAAVGTTAQIGAQGIVSDAEEMAGLMPGYRLGSFTQISDSFAHVLLLKDEIVLPEVWTGGRQGASQTAAESSHPPLPTRTVALELFAVDLAQSFTVDDLPWGDDPRPYWHTERVDMGTWRGHRWFADAAIFQQERLRKMLGFEGGDDRIALLIKGLGIDDRGNITNNSSQSRLAVFGEEAVPYLEQAIDGSQEQVSWSALSTLGKIQGDASTKILLEHFDGDNPKLVSAAAYGLIHKPYRLQAKEAYRQMAVEQNYLRQVSGAVLEFHWMDFIPDLSAVLEDAEHSSAYWIAFETLRALKGTPVPESLIDAKDTVRTTAFMQNRDEISFVEPHRVFLESPDVEAATLLAIVLSRYSTKGAVSRINAFGLSVLDQLPRDEVLKVMHRLESSVRSEDDKEAIRELRLRWND